MALREFPGCSVLFERLEGHECFGEDKMTSIVPTIAKKKDPSSSSLRRRRPWVARDVSAFQELEQVGEGTYG